MLWYKYGLMTEVRCHQKALRRFYVLRGPFHERVFQRDSNSIENWF